MKHVQNSNTVLIVQNREDKPKVKSGLTMKTTGDSAEAVDNKFSTVGYSFLKEAGFHSLKVSY